ncbi:MAG TPA: hypothetical protein VGI82_09430 [Chitinophagaceae bacterium]|jgi:hypothetical protein
MKWLVTILSGIVLQSQSCKKENGVRMPLCIQDKIEAIRQQPRFNPPAAVYRFLFKDKYVFLFSSNCCDQYDYVYDRDCNIICAPSGGIAGKGDGRCTNFLQMASDKTLMWKDTR